MPTDTLVDIDIPDDSGVVTRQDVVLPSRHAGVRSGRLAGTVRSVGGATITSGRVALSSVQRTASIRESRFVMDSLAGGTYVVAVSAIGYLPQTFITTLRDSAVATIDVLLHPAPTLLAPVSVVGRAARDSAVVGTLREHARVAGGSIFFPDNPWLKSALQPSDVIAAARGFTLISPSLAIVQRDPGCSTRERLDGVRRNGGQNIIALYLDGTPFGGSLEELNDAVPKAALLAVEVYPDVEAAPPLWRRPGVCAVIAVWTKY